MHEDIYVALRGAFGAARCQSDDFGRRQRGEIKTHEDTLPGQVARLFGDGFDLIETVDGQEYYFNRDNVAHPDFDKLDIGNQVQFLEEAAAQARQRRQAPVSRLGSTHHSTSPVRKAAQGAHFHVEAAEIPFRGGRYASCFRGCGNMARMVLPGIRRTLPPHKLNAPHLPSENAHYHGGRGRAARERRFVPMWWRSGNFSRLRRSNCAACRCR